MTNGRTLRNIFSDYGVENLDGHPVHCGCDMGVKWYGPERPQMVAVECNECGLLLEVDGTAALEHAADIEAAWYRRDTLEV